MNQAEILVEALPYIKKFRGKRMLIKIGGSVLESDSLTKLVAQDIVLLSYVGVKVVVVHGGGKHISSLMKRLGKKNEFIEGLRVTDEETMEITQMVLAGWVNKNLTGCIEQEGGSAVGISGKDASFIRARKLVHETVNYGLVGKIEHIDTTLLEKLLMSEFIPVISPIASDGVGGTLNVNGDTAAAQIAAALRAEKLIFITDVKGLYRDLKDENSLIDTLSVKEVPTLIKDKIIQGGMIPKLNLAQSLMSHDKETEAKGNVRSIHLISGQISHALLLELFTEKGIGTKLF